MKIFITGGAGFLGTALTKHYLNKYPFFNKVYVYSRDGSKHWSLTNSLKSAEHTDCGCCQCFIGDICSPHLLRYVDKSCPDVIIIAHALKQIDLCESNPSEALRVNVAGVENVIDIVRKLPQLTGNFPRQVVFISSDKASNPISVYGTTKLLAEQLIQQAAVEMPHVIWTVARYGNVLSSTNSVIPLIKQRIASGNDLELTSNTMTRFVFTVKKAVEFIDYLVDHQLSGTWIPIMPSMMIRDLFQIYSEHYGVKVNLLQGSRGFREKEHEILNTDHEQLEDAWTTHDELEPRYKKLTFGRAQEVISSKTVQLTKVQLKLLLENENLL